MEVMWEILQRFQLEGRLVRVERDTVRGASTEGFVGAVSDDFVVINVLSGCHFDGGVVARTEDITRIHWGEAAQEARARVAAESPTAPEAVRRFDLSSSETVLAALAQGEPVLTLHRERCDDWHLVTDVAVSGDRVEARNITAEGRIDGSLTFKVSELTKIDFGGVYERGYSRMLRSARVHP